ncbi:glutamate--tRNA ligase, partial [Patescibacteria group bacterium]
LFNLAGIIDDHEIKISHVIRGEDHLSNMPKQILLQRALGFEEPLWAHLPLILGKDRSKLSKRGGATSVNEYKSLGYLPEAILNFMILMGWHAEDDEKEILSTKEMIEEFTLSRIQKSGAIFDKEKLDWLNGYYIRSMDKNKLAELLMPYLANISKEDAIKITALEQERLKTLGEINEKTSYLFKEPEYDIELLSWQGKQQMQDVAENLDKIIKVLDSIKPSDFNESQLSANIMPIAEKQGRGELLWPLRAALSGSKASPGPFEILAVLGKDKSIKRLKNAKKRIKL